MTKTAHFEALRQMYLSAPINQFYQPDLTIEPGKARVATLVDQRHHHAAGAVHGSVYFKLLDDAAFFAAQSLDPEFFVLTASFTTYLTRPVSAGQLNATGMVVHSGKTQYLAEAVLKDADGREIARGSGLFVRGRSRLSDIASYAAVSPNNHERPEQVD